MFKLKKLTYVLLIILVLTPLISAAHQLPSDIMTDEGLMYGMALWANNVTNGLFWTMLLAVFCIVLYIATSRYTTERAFGYAGVTGLFGSIFLIILNLMDWKIGTIFIGVGILGIVWLVVKRD